VPWLGRFDVIRIARHRAIVVTALTKVNVRKWALLSLPASVGDLVVEGQQWPIRGWTDM
jgi:hypothetical protein